jgi:hypothetical protein
MEKKESQVIRTIREALVKASEKGEDLKSKVAEITRDAVKKALEKTDQTQEKVEEGEERKEKKEEVGKRGQNPFFKESDKSDTLKKSLKE